MRWTMARPMWTKRSGLAMVALLIAGQADAQTKAFLLYGGKDNKTFLGCLNCGKFGATSVCNELEAMVLSLPAKVSGTSSEPTARIVV